jgi:RNA polymerase sigma factor (sigma-70 family)
MRVALQPRKERPPLLGDREQYDSRNDHFMRLYEPHHASAFTYACRLCRNIDDARDLLQESLEAALRGFHSLRNPDSFKPWLFQVIRNRYLNNIRHAKSANRFNFKVEDNSADCIDGASAERAKLFDALNNLTAEEREALILFEVEGLRLRDIAHIQHRTSQPSNTASAAGVRSSERLIFPTSPRRRLKTSRNRTIEVGNMNCKKFDKLLDEYFNGTLPPAMREAFESHAGQCNRCGRLFENSLALRRSLRTELSPGEPGGRNSFHSFKTQLEKSKSGLAYTIQPLEGVRMRRIIFILAMLLFMAIAAATVYACEYYNLLERLGDKNRDVRSAAAVELSENVWNTQVYDILTKALDDKSPEVRSAAAEALGMIVAKTKGLSTKLLEMLSDKDPRVQFQAMQALREVGFSSEAVPVLMEKLNGKYSANIYILADTICDVARLNLGWMDQLVTMLLDSLKSGPGYKRMEAANALGNLGPLPGVVDALMQALYDEDFNVRASAASSLADLGEDGKVAIPRLIEMLTEERPNLPTKEPDGRPRYQGDPYPIYLQLIASALGRFGPDAKDAVPALIKLYRQGDIYSVTPPPMQSPLPPNSTVVTVRMSAVQALGQIGAVTDDVIQIFTDAMADEEDGLPQCAFRALRRIGPKGIAALPELIKKLNDKYEVVCLSAATTIKEIGPDARAAVPTLVDMLLNNENAKRRTFATYPLSVMGPEPGVIPALVKAMNDDDEDVRCAAIRAFSTIGLEDDEAVSAIFSALQDESKEVQLSAASVLAKAGKHFEPALTVLIDLLGSDKQAALTARTLGDIGTEARGALPKIREITQDRAGDDYLYMAALYAQARISADVDQPLSKLIDILNNKDERIRRTAISLIGKIGPPAGSAVTALVITLSTGDSQIREDCVNALGQIGPDAASVLPILRALATKDSSQDVRDAAKEAIDKIESTP